MNLVENRKYRKDIDGLRAISVLAVIAYHFGLLPNGYLGVDVFFVISGYLITGIIVHELQENRFSIISFYIRRIRRIIPLSLFIALIALTIGFFTMLPDDLENLSQSVVATNFFSNNILQVLTRTSYWDVANEFRPLMHTWSLGIEEQYYLLYPFLFILLGGKSKSWIKPILIGLAIISLSLCFLNVDQWVKFYLIPFRFYELAAGGLLAIYFQRKVLVNKYSAVFIFGLLILFLSPINIIPSREVLLIITVLLTLGILSSSIEASKVSSFLLKNRIMVSVGLISYSLYMWHQVLLSFVRYLFVQTPNLFHYGLVFLLTVILSVFTYFLIERPFRSKSLVSVKVLLVTVTLVFVISTSAALHVYWKAGVFRDVPELNIQKTNTVRKLHAIYNNKIRELDRPFEENNKYKVLVIGHSFGRDWANVLLESKFGKMIYISYVIDPLNHDDIQNRIKQADIVFFSRAKREEVEKAGIPEQKLYVTGTKNFGTNAGFFYNYRGDGYYEQRTAMEDGYYESNLVLKKEWGERYLDFVEKIIDEDKTVPVFTPNGKFISQDCRHLTEPGAVYFSELFEKEITEIFSHLRKEKEQSQVKAP